jgi:hypothetical protein
MGNGDCETALELGGARLAKSPAIQSELAIILVRRCDRPNGAPSRDPALDHGSARL